MLLNQIHINLINSIGVLDLWVDKGDYNHQDSTSRLCIMKKSKCDCYISQQLGVKEF